MKGWVFFALPMVGLASFSFATRGGSRDEPQALRPAVSWSGPFSAVERPVYRRFTSGSEWMGFRQELVGDAASPGTRPLLQPSINFEDYMAVAICTGKQLSRGGVYLASAGDEGEVIRLRFGHMATAVRDQPEVTPYGIFVLPRSSKPIVLEEDTSRFGGQPSWVERGLLPGLDAK